MGKTTGFLEFEREEVSRRPPQQRVRDFGEFELPVVKEQLERQGARCMDCGVPFCNTGCPLGNLIPDFNDQVFRNDYPRAFAYLDRTNNFPEVTGRVCPAPCETACVLGINRDPVSIKQIEHAIADRAIQEGWVVARPPRFLTGHKVAVVGSGPAGLAAAQELARMGHSVTVFEQADRPGGLLVYGIPDFKLSKALIQARIEQLVAEGVTFRTHCHVGRDVTLAALRRDHHAICLAIGSRVPRDLPVVGRELSGIHFALDFLIQQNRRFAQDAEPPQPILATGKRVLVIGGGDTGSDCIGTALRQGAASVTSFEIMPKPPGQRSPATPWPTWPLMLRTSSSHEEGGVREFAVLTERFTGTEGAVRRVQACRVRWDTGRPEKTEGSEFELDVDLVLLAMGFAHPEPAGLLEQLGAAKDARGNIKVDAGMMTSIPGVFAAGDCQRGQALVVWAIADGRKAARSIDRFLSDEVEIV